MRAPREYLTSEEAAAYVRAPNARALRKWAQRHHVIPLRRGRRLLFERADLDGELERHRWGQAKAARRQHGSESAADAA
jgi:Helix-turn-helix domain